MMKRTLTPALVAALTLAALGADGSVDLELRGNEKVSGTLRPASDTESFACRIPRGATLAAVVKSKVKGISAPPFDVSLTRNDVVVPGAAFTVKGAALSLTGFPVAESAVYRVVVTGFGGEDGDYDLSLSVKPAKSFSQAGASLDGGAETEFTFGAPAGALATIEAKPTPGSGFVGGIAGFLHPSGAFEAPIEPPPRQTLTILGTGDATVTLRNRGATGGYSLTVKLKLPKTAKGKIDIRDGAAAGFSDARSVFGRVLGQDGGTLDLPGGAGPLDGSSISIPAGVLGGAVVVTISSAPPLPETDGNHSAGPAVHFGPSGTVFDPTENDPAKQATLTIPFDPAAFPNGTDSMVIYVRDAAGKVTAVPKPYLIGAGTVSFSASHLSAYQAASPDPRPLAGSFIVLDVVNELKSRFGGEFGFGLHALDVAGSTAQLAKDEVTLTWFRGADGSGAAEYGTDFGTEILDVAVDPADDSTVLFTPRGGQDPPLTFRRGADGDVLVADGLPVVLLRRAAGAPSVSLLAGRWHVFRIGFSSRDDASSAPPAVDLRFGGDRGVVDLLPDGRAVIRSIAGAETTLDFPKGGWTALPPEGPPGTLQWGVEDGSVQFGEPDDPDPIRLVPVVRGDVLVGRSAPPPVQSGGDREVELFVLIRASAKFAQSGAEGRYFLASNAVETLDRGIVPENARPVLRSLAATISAAGDVAVEGRESTGAHDGNGNDVLTEVAVPLTNSDRITAKSDGSFASTSGEPGAFAPGGLVFVRAGISGSRFSLDFATKRPPLPGKSPR